VRLKTLIAAVTSVLALGAAPAVAQALTGATVLAQGSNTIYNLYVETPSNVEGFPISGLSPGQAVVGIDYRPADGRLYALGVAGTAVTLYTLDPATGVAIPAGPAATVSAISGATSYGIDFSPVSDRLRVVASNGANFRMTPTGAVAAVDPGLDFSGLPGGAAANGAAVGIAYDRDFAGASATTLFDVLATGDRLTIQGGPNGAPTPNSGILSNVGPLGADIGPSAGFDIGGPAEVAYGVFQVGGVSSLYTVDLTSGAATPIGKIGTGAIPIAGLAVELPRLQPAPSPTPEPPAPPPPPAPSAQPPSPTLGALSLAPRSFEAASKGGSVLARPGKTGVGSTVTYALDGSATVWFSVERRLPGRRVGSSCVPKRDVNRKRSPCPIYRPRPGSFEHSGGAGTNAFRFSGRLNGRALPPGRYRLVGVVGASTVRAAFRILP
jgi:Domain of unknown function (DUF4394)